jgi:plasmid stabilization system protein ParE
MTLRLRPDADIDYAESLLYYLTEETPQSAVRFTDELEVAYHGIRQAPYQARVVEYGFRERE